MPSEDEDEGGDEWRFTLADLEDEGTEEVRPGDPSPENVAFFIAGVLVAVGSIVLLVA